MPALPVVDTAAALTRLQRAVTQLAAAFDARSLGRDDAVEALRLWTQIINAASAARALTAAHIAECGAPPSAGVTTVAEFVAKQTGTTTARARDAIATGRGLEQHGKTRALATSGSLSPDQAIAIVDAVDVAPDAEDGLLTACERDSLGQLRDHCARVKAAHTDMEAAEKTAHANRRLTRYRDCEGVEHLHASGPRRELARDESSTTSARGGRSVDRCRR